MVSVSRGSIAKPRQRGEKNEALKPYEPPPSTMAAALINNLSTTNKPSRQNEQDDLKALWELSTMLSNAEEPSNHEAKVEHHHKLIYVFMRLVLEPLASDDPFMDIQNVVSQASDAIDAFISAIKETPAVLAYTAKPDSFQGRGQEPLWVWLFPRMLALLGRRRCDALTEKIKDIFFVSFQAVSRSPKLWDLPSLFFCYLKECATIILNRLQSSSITASTHELSVVLHLDSVDSSMISYDNNDSPNASIQSIYAVQGPATGIWHVMNLLSMLVDIAMESASSHHATPAFRDYLAWMLESFFAATELQKRLQQDPKFQEFCKKSEIMGFCAVHALLSVLRESLSDTILRKGYILLSFLCADLLEAPSEISEKSIQLSLCSSLLSLATVSKQYESVRREVSLHLIPAVHATLCDASAISTLGKDFQKAGSALCQTCESEPLNGIVSNAPESFDSVQLDGEFCLIGLEPSGHQGPDQAPPNKRRKIHYQLDLLGEITENLYHLLGSQNASDLAGLAQLVAAGFAELNENDRTKAIEYLAMVPCAANGCIAVVRDEDGSIRYSKCHLCEGSQDLESFSRDDEACQRVSQDSILILTNLVQSEVFIQSRRPRVLGMVALQRFTIHFKNFDFMDLDTSLLGQWCLACLQSSIRELRILAGRTLPGFLDGLAMHDDLQTKNTGHAFRSLHSLMEKNDIHTQETCVLAWSQLGRILEDQDLNMVLLKLVEYLGHTNPVISGVAFNEILKLAKNKMSNETVQVEKLFSPFWDTIAVNAVKDLLIRPQTAQLMSDLMEIPVPDFLVLTQSHTLPWLVMHKKTDVIKRISQARKDNDDLEICITQNLVPILAMLLVQNVPTTEAYIMQTLRAISPGFKEFDVSDLLRTEPANLALCLLRAAAEADDAHKSRIRLAITFLANLAPPLDLASQKSEPLGIFIEHHILGIVARLVEVVKDARDEKPVREKRICIKAIEEMVKLGKSFTRTARPHLCACLQSAMTQKDLQSLSFSAWETMLRNLDDDDVELMLESTFSIIIRHWEDFDEDTRKQIEATLRYLLKDRARILRNSIVNLPSLSQFFPLTSVETQLKKLRTPTDVGNSFQIFSRRVSHENSKVVSQALVELKAYLQKHQSFLQASAVSEQPDLVIGRLVRSILDACVKFNETDLDVAQLSAECIGLIGCLDPNRVESVRERREMVVASNFEDSHETTDFILFLLDEVIVKVFLSSTDTSVQGFLSYVMQMLLETCDFSKRCTPIIRSGKRDSTDPIWLKWQSLPSSVQDTLTPFLTSRYAAAELKELKIEYPIFRPDSMRSDKVYNTWLKDFVMDLLQKPFNMNAVLIFAPLRRAIKIRDSSVAVFLLPYLVLHGIVAGTDEHREQIGAEMLGILQYQATATSQIKREDLTLCSEAVFRVLDYLSQWMRVKQSKITHSRGQPLIDAECHLVTSVLKSIPAEIVAQRAFECRSYSRALFYWEQHIRDIRERKEVEAATVNGTLERLQEIYTQIDEPDGIEGLSAHLHVLDIDQQILGHRKAGRWTAAQSWYEIKLAERPEDIEVQVNLLTCLKESGQHDVLLNYVEGMHASTTVVSRLLPFATEASWATGRWLALEKYTSMVPKGSADDFNVSIGKALLALHRKDIDQFSSTLQTLRKQIACSLSTATTPSLGACHDTMLKFHVLTELEMIAGTGNQDVDRGNVLESLNRRLEVLGAYLNDKQYLLGIRRAAMQLSSHEFTKGDIASAWLTSARLARKGNAMHQSFNAVLHASQLGDESATIEHARLLWKEGHHRKAIQSLQGAIDSNAFISHNKGAQATSFTGVDQTDQQNLLTARSHLLLAKWLDSAGQTHSSALRSQYQLAARTYSSWEKGHYYLGRHYNKLLESEKTLAPEHQAESYLTGETAKLVIENYLRSLSFGTKYIYQTLPRILTLWLDLGTQVNQHLDPKYGNVREFTNRILNGRKEQLALLHTRFNKYISKMPAYIFYTALPQIVARIAHPNVEIYKYLSQIIFKVVDAHPQQALWTLLAVSTSMQTDRKARGMQILQQLRSYNNKRAPPGATDMKLMIKMGERLTDQLLMVCNAGDFQGNRTAYASITRDLNFNHKICTPSPLAVPIESVLTATLPTLTDSVRGHKAFSRDVVTISSFEDEVLVLSSLQKPRKLTARGSDGRSYGLLCKPKDDLRKDQRLMEFNGMINRSLKRDAESSRRQLYIKTYAVTPLNEECGIIEWVEGLKTLRDILLALYKSMGISPNYQEINIFCEEAIKSPDKLPLFTDKVLKQFPPVFHLWFVQQFPEPSAWFAARLRYTRSCAVMSMVGTILGLGDRHGENILFEEGNGGTFHVDFNCLFDKGLTFSKPEKVPFRLTHNMIDAMGIYGYEGPFRKSSELTLKLLRQHEDTLMTILEAFVYDPTLDFLAKKDKKPKKEGSFIVPQTAQGVLDTIQRKVRGLLAGESVPLGVEGQVDELIKQATSHFFLAGMYIGWCSFF